MTDKINISVEEKNCGIEISVTAFVDTNERLGKGILELIKILKTNFPSIISSLPEVNKVEPKKSSR